MFFPSALELRRHVSLPVRPLVGTDESVTGHAFRSANRNGLPGRVLLNHLKAPLRHGVSKYCSECLKESGRFLREWDRDESLWCQRHQTWLIDTCPGCKSALRWQREQLLRCDCGVHLNHVRAQLIGELDSTTFQWLTGERKRAPGLPRVGKANRLNLAILIGAYASANGHDVPLHKRHGRTVAMRRDLLLQGLEKLKSWPHQFDGFLDDLYWRSACALPKSRESLLFTAFGRQLKRLCKHHPTDPVLTRYLSHQELHAKRAHNRRHSTLNEKVRQQNRWTTKTRASLVLGIHPSVFDRLVKEKLVLTSQRETAKGRTLTVVEQASLLKVHDSYGALRNGVGTAKALGCSKRQFRDFLRAGLIRPTLPQRHPGDVAIYSEKEVIRTLNNLETVAKTGQPIEPVDLNWVYRYIHLPSQNLVAWLLQAAWDRAVTTYLSPSGKPGLSGFCWSKSDVLSFARLHRNAISLGATDLAAQLHIKPEVLNHLVRCGALPLTNLHMISSQNAQLAKQRFEGEYVLLSRVAKERQMSPRWLALRLAKQGIDPVHGPAVDGCRMNIYRRRDIPNSLLGEAAP